MWCKKVTNEYFYILIIKLLFFLISPSISENTNGGFSIDSLSRKLLEKKIKAIFDICLQNKNDTLVVSAFSCGVYGCPPDIVASIFKEVFNQYGKINKLIIISIFFIKNFYLKKKDGCLDYFVFSLIEDVNSFKDHNPEGNVKPFSTYFKLPVQKITEGELSDQEANKEKEEQSTKEKEN